MAMMLGQLEKKYETRIMCLNAGFIVGLLRSVGKTGLVIWKYYKRMGINMHLFSSIAKRIAAFLEHTCRGSSRYQGHQKWMGLAPLLG